MNNFKKLISSCLIVCTTVAGFPPTAQARLVTTEEAVVAADAVASRATVDRFLARDDVRQALLSQGMAPDAA